MSKVTDAQILALKLQVEAGQTTVTKGCQALGITRQYYYKIQRKHKMVDISLQSLDNSLPLTLLELEGKAKRLLETLEKLERDPKKSISSIALQIRLLVPLINSLRKGAEIHLHKHEEVHFHELPQDAKDRLSREVLSEFLKELKENKRCPAFDGGLCPVKEVLIHGV